MTANKVFSLLVQFMRKEICLLRLKVKIYALMKKCRETASVVQLLACTLRVW